MSRYITATPGHLNCKDCSGQAFTPVVFPETDVFRHEQLHLNFDMARMVLPGLIETLKETHGIYLTER